MTDEEGLICFITFRLRTNKKLNQLFIKYPFNYSIRKMSNRDIF